MRRSNMFAALAAWLTILASAVALADSWMPPRQEAYYSRDFRLRFTVTPRDLENQLAYFEDKVAGKEPAGQRRGSSQTTARGVLERLGENGQWVVVWDRPLVNDVAPVSALVADAGAYVVTFDNWHAVGRGDHVAVIYGSDGTLIRSLSLADIVPEFYIEALPRSVSSVHWSGEHRISGGRLVLKIVVPSEDSDTQNLSYVDRVLDLANGSILTSDDALWRKALNQAQRVAEARQAEEAAARARFIAPLLGPNDNDEGRWHMYLLEAFYRIDPSSPGGYPRIKVLRAPAAANYQASEGWLCDAFVDMSGPVMMMASPASPDNLLRVLPGCVSRVPPGSLSGKRIYVAVPGAYFERAAALLAPTGAQIIPLDPATPIPQRRERLERLEPAAAKD
jgi:hypothetical protein